MIQPKEEVMRVSIQDRLEASQSVVKADIQARVEAALENWTNRITWVSVWLNGGSHTPCVHGWAASGVHRTRSNESGARDARMKPPKKRERGATAS